MGQKYIDDGNEEEGMKLLKMAAEKGSSKAKSIVLRKNAESKPVQLTGIARLMQAQEISFKSYGIQGLNTWWRYPDRRKGITLQEILEVAELGYPVAQHWIGVMYACGDWGCMQSDTKSAKWVLKAANGGIVASQSYISGSYKNGKGVPKNKIEAYKWRIIVEASDNAAVKDLAGGFWKVDDSLADMLGDKLSKEEMREAEDRAFKFAPRKIPSYYDIKNIMQ